MFLGGWTDLFGLCTVVSVMRWAVILGQRGWRMCAQGYSLAAGLALGLITLGRGRTAMGLADLRVEDRLR